MEKCINKSLSLFVEMKNYKKSIHKYTNFDLSTNLINIVDNSFNSVVENL